MSSSSAKSKGTCLSPKKKDSLHSEDPGILSPKKSLNSKKRRTSETASVPVEAKEETKPTLQVKLLSESATAPVRGSDGAAGYDLHSNDEYKIPSRGQLLVATDIAVAIPPGTYGRVAPRSGLAVKSGIDVGAGVIDADYRGPVCVLLFNHSDEEFEVKKGDRIAQLILERILTPEVEVVDELSETKRGENGFGSTGVGTDCTNTVENQ